jgi:hypothetical protein
MSSITKNRCAFGPYHLRGDQASFIQAASQRPRGGRRKLRIGTEHVQQHIGIDGGDHGLPRSRAIVASASIFLPRHPYTSLTGSAPPLFTAMRRPCSSLNSRTVPGLTPSLSLRRFGIVTWPRSATRAFILFMYESMETFQGFLKPGFREPLRLLTLARRAGLAPRRFQRSLSNEAAGAPFGDGLDALAMVLGAHQPILLDELDIRLRLHRFSQSPADRRTG